MRPLLPNGCWAEIRPPADPGPRPCLFLDRDGVVIVDRHHLADPERVTLLPGAVEAVLAANRRGWRVGLVTNQSGIARRLFDWEAFAAVQARLEREIAVVGARLDFVCACPHHGSGLPPYDVDDHPWRKPNPGMLLHAAEKLAILLDRSVMVGDRASDIAAGHAAGVGRCFLVGEQPGEAAATAALGLTFDRVRDLSTVSPLLA